jgi:hypothetical protein
LRRIFFLLALFRFTVLPNLFTLAADVMAACDFETPSISFACALSVPGVSSDHSAAHAPTRSRSGSAPAALASASASASAFAPLIAPRPRSGSNRYWPLPMRVVNRTNPRDVAPPGLPSSSSAASASSAAAASAIRAPVDFHLSPPAARSGVVQALFFKRDLIRESRFVCVVCRCMAFGCNQENFAHRRALWMSAHPLPVSVFASFRSAYLLACKSAHD